jgi:hypothetical protein
MRTRTLWITMAVVAVMALVGSAALADGDTRPASAGEIACAGKTLGVLCGAIPPQPPGWVVSHKSDAQPPRFVSGTKPRPMELVCEQSWENRGKKQQAQMDAMNAMSNVKPDAAAEANSAAAEKRFNDVMAKLTAASQKGDQAAIQKLQPEMQAASKAYQDAMMAKNKGMMDAAAKGQAQDADAKVRIEVNARYEYLQVVGQEQVGPGVTGYRVKGGSNDSGATWVFLGPWQISKDGSSTRFQVPPLTGPSCAVVTVRIRVEAEQARAKAILDKVNWTALQGLLR